MPDTAPVLVTEITARLQRMAIPDAAGMPDALQLETGSLGDPLAVARITFDGEHVDRLGEPVQVTVIVPVLDLLHLRSVVDGAISTAEQRGSLQLAEQDRR
jgi:hypothetical protein